jgi:hypothetical protein
MLREQGVDARVLAGGVSAFLGTGRALATGPNP